MPNWHHPTASPPSYTSTWRTVPLSVCARLAILWSSAVPARPSGWKPMHQHPPHTPLLASTSAAKSAQVSGVRSLVSYDGVVGHGATVVRVPDEAGS